MMFSLHTIFSAVLNVCHILQDDIELFDPRLRILDWPSIPIVRLRFQIVGVVSKGRITDSTLSEQD